MRYFDNAVAGDRVWSFVHGWGTIVGITDAGNSFGLDIEFDNRDGYWYSYSLDGKDDYRDNQTLFWGEIEFSIPEKKLSYEECKARYKPQPFAGQRMKQYVIFYNHQHKKWYSHHIITHASSEIIGVDYYGECESAELVELLNNNKVEPPRK